MLITSLTFPHVSHLFTW